MEFNCLAEVTFMLWVFMAIITNNRKRLDVAESLSAGWGAGTDSVCQCVWSLKQGQGVCLYTHIPACTQVCVKLCLVPVFSGHSRKAFAGRHQFHTLIPTSTWDLMKKGEFILLELTESDYKINSKCRCGCTLNVSTSRDGYSFSS